MRRSARSFAPAARSLWLFDVRICVLLWTEYGLGLQAEKGLTNVGQFDERRHFMTVAEVAQLMRVSTMTVYRLIKAGELSAVRVGRSYRLRPDDVDRYLGDRYTEAG